MTSVEARVSMGVETRMTTSNESGQPVRIMVVDDDPAMLDMIVNYLDEHGIRGIAASGPQDILRDFAESEPDLVILDLHLGQADGFDLLRSIRSRSARWHLTSRRRRRKCWCRASRMQVRAVSAKSRSRAWNGRCPICWSSTAWSHRHE